jgi:hypothetical protein
MSGLSRFIISFSDNLKTRVEKTGLDNDAVSKRVVDVTTSFVSILRNPKVLKPTIPIESISEKTAPVIFASVHILSNIKESDSACPCKFENISRRKNISIGIFMSRPKKRLPVNI